MDTIGQSRKKNEKKYTNVKDVSRRFYQTTEWRHIREENRKMKREKHEKIVMDVYRSNPGNKAEDLMEFIFDSKKYPLSEKSLKEGIIKRANTLDHIKDIKNDGAKLSHSNLQWLTAEEHNLKTRKESD